MDGQCSYASNHESMRAVAYNSVCSSVSITRVSDARYLLFRAANGCPNQSMKATPFFPQVHALPLYDDFNDRTERVMRTSKCVPMLLPATDRLSYVYIWRYPESSANLKEPLNSLNSMLGNLSKKLSKDMAKSLFLGFYNYQLMPRAFANAVEPISPI